MNLYVILTISQDVECLHRASKGDATHRLSLGQVVGDALVGALDHELYTYKLLAALLHKNFHKNKNGITVQLPSFVNV